VCAVRAVEGVCLGGLVVDFGFDLVLDWSLFSWSEVEGMETSSSSWLDG